MKPSFLLLKNNYYSSDWIQGNYMSAQNLYKEMAMR